MCEEKKSTLCWRISTEGLESFAYMRRAEGKERPHLHQRSPVCQLLLDALKLCASDRVDAEQQLHIAQGALQLSNHSLRDVLQELLSLQASESGESAPQSHQSMLLCSLPTYRLGGTWEWCISHGNKEARLGSCAAGLCTSL